MGSSHLRIRITAFAAATVIAGTLLSTIVTHMPPNFGGSPTLARATVPEARTEVAIVPARIEVIGLRSSDTAANEITSARPRS